MTYEVIFNSLQSAYEWLFGIFFPRIFAFLKNNELVSAALIISLVLPALLLIFNFFLDASSDAELYTSKMIKNKRLKSIKEQQISAARSVAEVYFKNNPSRMSVTVDGFRFLQEGFENKHWGNSKKTRVSKKYRYNDNGELYVASTSISSNEVYHNTSDLQLNSSYDAD